VLWSGEMSPAWGGAVAGSTSPWKTGPAVPSTVDWRAVSRVTMSWTAAAEAGSVIVPPGFETSRMNDCEAGACGPAFALASLKIWFASID